MKSADYRAKYKEWDEHVKSAEQLVKDAKEGVDRANRVLLDAEGLLWRARFERRDCEDKFFLQVQREEALEADAKIIEEAEALLEQGRFDEDNAKLDERSAK